MADVNRLTSFKMADDHNTTNVRVTDANHNSQSKMADINRLNCSQMADDHNATNVRVADANHNNCPRTVTNVKMSLSTSTVKTL